MLLVLLASCVVTRCFADARAPVSAEERARARPRDDIISWRSNKQSIETNVAAWYRDSKFNVKGRAKPRERNKERRAHTRI